MQGLIEMISAGNDEVMQRRMGLVDVSRGVARSLVMDAELEEYEQIGAQFTGVPEPGAVSLLLIGAAGLLLRRKR